MAKTMGSEALAKDVKPKVITQLGKAEPKPKKRQQGPVMRNKDERQRYSCLFCTGKALLEAAYKNAAIRCCRNPECIEQAKKLALAL